MRNKLLAVGAALALLAMGRLGFAMSQPSPSAQGSEHREDQPVIRRQEDEAPALVVLDDLDDDPDTGDGDLTTGDDGTNGGDNTGDGDLTTGDDGTNGGDNTGDGDLTTGDDGTNGGDNTGDGDLTTGDDGTNGGDNTGDVTTADGDPTTGDDTDD